MRGKRVLGENSRRRSFSKKTNSVNGGKAKGTPEKVVLIDLEDDVVIIDDATESLDKNFGMSEAPRDHGNTHVESVINIDDDDCDDDDTEVGAGISVVVDDADLASDANSSQSRFPTFRTMGSSVYRHAEGYEFFAEKATTFQFSKCKRKYLTKSPVKNRYGLDPTPDDVSTDSDSSDCEIGSDSEGWNRAALRRKRPQNLSSFFEDQTSACESNNGEERHPRPISGKADRAAENQADFVASNRAYVNTSSYRTSPVSCSMDVDQESEERAESVLEKESPWRNEDFQPEVGSGSGSGSGADEDVFDGIFGNKAEEPCPQQSFMEPEECHRCKSLICRCIPVYWNCEEPSASGSPFRSFEQEVSDKQAMPPRTPLMEKDHLDSRQNSSLFDGTQVNVEHCLDDNIGGGSRDIFSRLVNFEGTIVHNSTQGRPNLNLNEAYGNLESAQPVETCIITDRQKLKDTEEFRRANEEEWAARQRELRSQAEEAQKLRRRKKAETLRLNNIERRQKERVEEVRENQKKNAEDINLKEQLRGEIRKEINKLEITCFDMASLLRGLGIPVNGGFKPMSQDVNAAYKRALLKFHPDRASRMDIRQQVESEEKFKLISRMKEKFFTTCC